VIDVPGGRAWAVIRRCAGDVLAADEIRRRLRPEALGHAIPIGRDAMRDPMHRAGSFVAVGIENDQREALHARRCAVPGERGRNILAAAIGGRGLAALGDEMSRIFCRHEAPSSNALDVTVSAAALWGTGAAANITSRASAPTMVHAPMLIGVLPPSSELRSCAIAVVIMSRIAMILRSHSHIEARPDHRKAESNSAERSKGRRRAERIHKIG